MIIWWYEFHNMKPKLWRRNLEEEKLRLSRAISGSQVAIFRVKQILHQVFATMRSIFESITDHWHFTALEKSALNTSCRMGEVFISNIRTSVNNYHWIWKEKSLLLIPFIDIYLEIFAMMDLFAKLKMFNFDCLVTYSWKKLFTYMFWIYAF